MKRTRRAPQIAAATKDKLKRAGRRALVDSEDEASQ